MIFNVTVNKKVKYNANERKLKYIDKFKRAFDRQDYELLGKMLNELGELRLNYLNTAPLVLLDSIHSLICYAKDIKKTLRTCITMNLD